MFFFRKQASNFFFGSLAKWIALRLSVLKKNQQSLLKFRLYFVGLNQVVTIKTSCLNSQFANKWVCEYASTRPAITVSQPASAQPGAQLHRAQKVETFFILKFYNLQVSNSYFFKNQTGAYILLYLIYTLILCIVKIIL